MSATDKVLGVLRDWLGEGGKPVDARKATRRAEICSSCPFNYKAGYRQILKLAVADTIKLHLEVKNNADLRTQFDKDLHLCKVCNCVAALKVWVPFEHIRAHTSDKQLNKFPIFCWIRQEARPINHAPIH